MRFLARLAVAAIFFCFSFGVQSSALLAQGNVVGTTYTSPHFDYQVQWSSPWFFLEEGTDEGVDFLFLSDGMSYADFNFRFLPGTDALFARDVLTAPEDPSGEVTNIRPLVDAQGIPVAGGDATHAWGGTIGTYTLDDGTTVEFADYYDVRTLEGGVLYFMNAYAPMYFYDDSILLSWQNLASTALIMPEQPSPTPGTTLKPTMVTEVTATPPATATPQVTATPPATATIVPEIPTPTPTAPVPVRSGEGEPAPAFAASPWRVAVRAVDQGEAIEYLGLGFIDGMRWVVVYADVTNWSEVDAELDGTGMTLVTAGGPVTLDQAATQSAATLLGLEPANGASVPVPAGGSTRVALIYSIPAAETELILEMGGTQLPLADAVGRQFDVTDLSTIATPPAETTATVASVQIDGSGQLQLTANTGNGTTTVALTGVSLPVGAACFDQAPTLTMASELVGKDVWLETDPAVAGTDTYYVWYEDGQGNRVLLNQTVIAGGLAVEGDLPDAARFSAWMEQTEALARAGGTGLWAACAGQL